MSKRKPTNRCGHDGEVYWGGADYNARLYNAYLNQVMQMAISRFEWRGLPATVDAIFLERMLLCYGQATIARPKRGDKKGFWYATRVATDGPLNVYDRPSKWVAIARDIVRFKVTPLNGVLIYDNVNHLPILDALDLAVRELVDIQKTKQVNRFHQKVPYILVTDQDNELSAENLLLNIMSGQPATIARRPVTNIEPYTLDFKVPYLGTELTAAEQNVWNRIYTLLGIANVTYKSERMIEDEVRTMSEPASMMSLSGLLERRRAAEQLTSLTGQEVSVIWRCDNLSENINALENVETATKIIAGQNKGIGEVLTNE